MSRKPARQPRPDGDNTRALIIDAAGELFGEHGYDGTTSKAICERAQVNLAAINYHFGGRDGLYRAVLHEVHQRLMSVQTLEALIHHPLPPAEKLRRFYHHITALLMDKDSWPLRVWARELISPSPFWNSVENEEIRPKFDLLVQLVAELSGLAAEDPRLLQLALQIMAPCLAMMVAGSERHTPFRALFQEDSDQLAEQFHAFAVAGIKEVTQKRQK